MNHPVKLEDNVCRFLVVIYVRLNVKTKKVCNISTKICYSINNYVYHGENQSRQEVENGHIFEKII